MKETSKTSPKGGKRGCLCKDGKYSKKCCNGDLQEQGVGALVGEGVSQVENTNEARTIVSNNG
jgi:hypothetical protein